MIIFWFCYYSCFFIVGNCCMCLVEVEKILKFVVFCVMFVLLGLIL